MYLVGIAGGSASGKSTFTAALQTALQARDSTLRLEALTTDRYWQDRDGGPRFVSPSSGEDRFDFNHPDALDQQALLADLNRLSATVDVVLLEGLMVLHTPAIRSRLDLRLFVELDADERALRRMLRDMQGGRTYTDPQMIVTYYRESARIGHARYVEPSRVHADLILRGDGDFAHTAHMVAAVVSDALSAGKAG